MTVLLLSCSYYFTFAQDNTVIPGPDRSEGEGPFERLIIRGGILIDVQAIVGELRGEKIDIIAWSDDSVKFVTNALSPAKIAKVVVHEEENTMEVIVPEDQLSLAIGKKGQNVRLAAKLTRWKINIKSEENFKKEQDEVALAAAEALLGPRKRPAEPTLEHIPGVGGKTAEVLREAGFSSLTSVASASLEDFLAVPGIGKKKAEAMREAAIEMLAEAPPGEPEGDELSVETTPAAVEDRTDEEASLSTGSPEEAAEALLGLRKRPAEPTLEHIPGVGGKTAETLREAGFSSLASVASASLEDLSAVPGIGKKKAEAMREAAIEMLAEAPPQGEAQEEVPLSTGSPEEVAEALPPNQASDVEQEDNEGSPS